MIRKREEKDNWKVVFLAANQDAIEEGAKFGINQNRAMTYHADNEGISNAFISFSNKLSNFKHSASMDLKFDQEDRKKQQRDALKNKR
jgi:hypothetical protein